MSKDQLYEILERLNQEKNMNRETVTDDKPQKNDWNPLNFFQKGKMSILDEIIKELEERFPNIYTEELTL